MLAVLRHAYATCLHTFGQALQAAVFPLFGLGSVKNHFCISAGKKTRRDKIQRGNQ